MATAAVASVRLLPVTTTARSLVNQKLLRLSSCCNLGQVRGVRIFNKSEPPSFEHREPPVNMSQPDMYKLPTLPKAPSEQVTAMVNWPKGTKDLRRYVGEEEVHNKLILGQYAIVATSGGAMHWKHFQTMIHKINKYLNPEESFGILRVDPPYKPVTSKSGKRMGGGKGKVKTYSSTIKAGRVIVEIGGKVGWDEVQPWLAGIAGTLPINAFAVSQDILDRMNAEEEQMERANMNPLTLEWFIRNNIMDCQRFMSPYDIKLMGKFTYKDMHNQKKWSLARDQPYRRPGGSLPK